MKKILIIATSLLIVLAGCGAKTDYGTFVSDVKPISNANSIEIVLGSTFSDTGTDLDGTSFEISYIFDTKNDLMKMTIDGTEIYLSKDTMYISVLGSWIKKSYDINQVGELKEVMTYKDVITNLPKGNKTIATDATGIDAIDSVIGGKTLDELVVNTEPNKYQITGLEDHLAVTTDDGLQLIVTTEETGEIYLTFKETEELALPAETDSSIDADSLGSILGDAEQSEI
ncbi:hypothetical protein R2F61_07765 [Mollicutes bacterium LVI A0078]|nr:hypothetical protein RZE84_07535 [Mollicutes bacterium LVI A0075]WOO90617.1 hypothetical protein R2F61_07765 [Mollicutes bacterium LVI A0078]